MSTLDDARQALEYVERVLQHSQTDFEQQAKNELKEGPYGTTTGRSIADEAKILRFFTSEGIRSVEWTRLDLESLSADVRVPLETLASSLIILAVDPVREILRSDSITAEEALRLQHGVRQRLEKLITDSAAKAKNLELKADALRKRLRELQRRAEQDIDSELANLKAMGTPDIDDTMDRIKKLRDSTEGITSGVRNAMVAQKLDFQPLGGVSGFVANSAKSNLGFVSVPQSVGAEFHVSPWVTAISALLTWLAFITGTTLIGESSPSIRAIIVAGIPAAFCVVFIEQVITPWARKRDEHRRKNQRIYEVITNGVFRIPSAIGSWIALEKMKIHHSEEIGLLEESATFYDDSL